MRIGIDIGRVLIAPTVDGREDTSFLGRTYDEAMTTPPAPSSFDVVRDLVERTGGAVWLVSKAGPSVQRKTVGWLAHHGFHEATGLPPDKVRFCRKRHEKAGHCEELGLTHFLDDRRDVLGHLAGLVPHRLLFGEQAAPPPPWAIPLRSWPEVGRWFDRRFSAGEVGVRAQ